jgi:hypothetical protein
LNYQLIIILDKFHYFFENKVTVTFRKYNSGEIAYEIKYYWKWI